VSGPWPLSKGSQDEAAFTTRKDQETKKEPNEEDKKPDAGSSCSRIVAVCLLRESPGEESAVSAGTERYSATEPIVSQTPEKRNSGSKGGGLLQLSSQFRSFAPSATFMRMPQLDCQSEDESEPAETEPTKRSQFAGNSQRRRFRQSGLSW